VVCLFASAISILLFFTAGFLFALAVSPNFTASQLLWSFVIIHLLLYPASNGYNSYFDKDEKSIGGLKNPPPVNKTLYYAALLLDALAIVLGWFFISIWFGLCFWFTDWCQRHIVTRLSG
jgi:hypothetical protein